ncbi:hypothetical protein P43SY_000092 [Pythium insidiosum]|uniref:Enhancer of mRNA-decapping protein 4 WD40 repeat region domain-containing protein n=1 Tax=Pythium insidiosum TaxID=114742 RepID=A0AAD5Q1X9_PYTIN|nr:hypothetical protein P43SY_000092 [Pythium insidiosum]
MSHHRTNSTGSAGSSSSNSASASHRHPLPSPPAPSAARPTGPLMYPPPPPPPTSLGAMLGRPGPMPGSDQNLSPEITQPPNSLQHLMFQQQNEANQFLRQFMTHGTASIPPSGPPRSSSVPLPPSTPHPFPLMRPLQPMMHHPPPSSSMPPAPMLPQTMQLPVPPMSAPSPLSSGLISVSTAVPSLPRSHSEPLPQSPLAGPPPGTPIAGDFYEHRVSEHLHQGSQLEATPITLYASQRTAAWGNLVAVSDQFIMYPTKNGLIRLLHHSTVSRLLLREHQDHAVLDVGFFSPRSDLVFSFGSDDKIVVHTIAADPIGHTVSKVIRTPAQRVLWHPHDSNRLAVVRGDIVFIVDLALLPTPPVSDDEPTDLSRVSVRCTQTTSQINDAVFSLCGRYLVTAGMDGFVHIYRVDNCEIGSAAVLLHRFEPFDGGEVWSVRFFSGGADGATGLLIGGELNSKITLWEAPLVEGAQPTCVQTVKIVNDEEGIQSPGPIYDLMFDPSTQFLMVTDRTRPTLHVLHLAPRPPTRGGIRRFDNITEFPVVSPILSATMLNRSASGEDSSADLQMMLFTQQTTAIQRYNVSARRCFAPALATSDEARTGSPARLPVSAGQSVGAETTEGEDEETSFQAPAESPRATVTTPAPETEVDVQAYPQQNGDEESEHGATLSVSALSPASSPRRSAPPLIINARDDASSIAGEDAVSSLRSYARSSPSSSVRAFHDDTSQLGELSVDESVAGTDQIMAMLRRMEAKQLQREERQREAMQKMMVMLSTQITSQTSQQVEKAVKQQVQSVLIPAMARIVLHTMENNVLKPLQTGFERVITEQLIVGMETKINTSLSTLPDRMEDGVADIVKGVVEDVRQPVRESFRECFRDIIIPSFQAATQKMFEQIHEHVLKGSALSAGGAETNRQIQQLVDAVDKLSHKVDQLSLAPNGHPGSGESLTPEDQKLADNKKHVLALIAAQEFEEAFQYALGAQDLRLVLLACESCDPRVVLATRPPRLTQMVILCLVQQLGSDVMSDMDVKITWLSSSLLVLNPRDRSIEGFVASVLRELQTQLNAVPEERQDSQFTLVHHILNSHLSSV